MTIALLEPASITKDQRVMSHVDSTPSPFTAPHLASVLGRIGTMEVCLAQTEDEIASSQQLRFKVFFDELGAKGSATMEQRDADRFDPFCDHLLVYDTSIAGPKHKQIVGTYRLLRSEKAFETGGFYSASEFSIERLVAAKPELRFLELGRSCVLPEYRSKTDGRIALARYLDLLPPPLDWRDVRLCILPGNGSCRARTAFVLPAA